MKGWYTDARECPNAGHAMMLRWYSDNSSQGLRCLPCSFWPLQRSHQLLASLSARDEPHLIVTSCEHVLLATVSKYARLGDFDDLAMVIDWSYPELYLGSTSFMVAIAWDIWIGDWGACTRIQTYDVSIKLEYSAESVAHGTND